MAPEDAGVQEQPQEPLVRTDHRGIDSPAGAATNAGQREDLQAYLEGLDEFMAGLEETPPATGSGANPPCVTTRKQACLGAGGDSVAPPPLDNWVDPRSVARKERMERIAARKSRKAFLAR